MVQELSDSILWNEVNVQSSEAAVVDGGSDWKSWKQEVMKWFSVSNPISNAVDLDQPVTDNSLTTEVQTTRKRAKLEIRRADTHASSSHQSLFVETDASFFNGYNTGLLDAETLKRNSPVENVANKWNDIVVEDGNLEVVKTPSVVTQKSTEPGSHNRQCEAFIEAKGRQCVRYASEGDVYCCVHLSSRFTSN